MRSAWLRGGAAAVGLSFAAACIPENEKKPPAFLAAPDAGPRAATGTEAELAKDPKALLARVDALKTELEGRPRTFQINVALGTLYYDNGRYIEAIQYFRDALASAATAEQRLLALKAEPRLAGADAAVPEACRVDVPDERAAAEGQKLRSLETIAEQAQKLEATDPAAAAACWSQALPSIALVHAKRGNSWYLIGNPDKAREDHEAALRLDENHPEALFFSGALQLELAKGDPVQLAAGKKAWERLLAVAPDHARAALVRETLPRVDQIFGARPDLSAAHGGSPHVAMAQPGGDTTPAVAGPSAPAVDPATMQAFQNTEMTPELAASLDKLLVQGEQQVADGKWQEALETLRGVMPYRPDGRVALALGIALRELGKPTAERVLTQAQRMPGGDPPRAKLELAKLYERTNVPQARTLLGELAGDPRLGAEAKARLAKLP
jgi:tetratricopeptide (TPR) repeat protein